MRVCSQLHSRAAEQLCLKQIGCVFLEVARSPDTGGAEPAQLLWDSILASLCSSRLPVGFLFYHKMDAESLGTMCAFWPRRLRKHSKGDRSFPLGQYPLDVSLEFHWGTLEHFILARPESHNYTVVFKWHLVTDFDLCSFNREGGYWGHLTMPLLGKHQIINEMTGEWRLFLRFIRLRNSVLQGEISRGVWTS